MLRDRVAFPFLFLFFSFFLLCFSTRKTVLWKTSALNIHSTVLLIGILLMSFSISLNKKELYEKHVQKLYSNRKGSDNRHSRVSFSNLGVLKNFTPESPLSSMTRIGTWALWRSSLINLLKIILISTKKDVFINKNLCYFSTEKIGRMLPKHWTRNWKRGVGSECTVIICIRI